MNFPKQLRPEKYLRYLHLPHIFGARRTKEILSVNPTVIPHREEAKEVAVFVFDYDSESIHEKQLPSVQDCFQFKGNGRITWINVDGLRKADVEAICNHFGIHALIVEDILSINQRPKMEESEGVLFCLLNMLYYVPDKRAVEQEQISIVLGKNFVISFQEDPTRDVFNSLREKMKLTSSRLRQAGADYLCYTMLDLIVDH